MFQFVLRSKNDIEASVWFFHHVHHDENGMSFREFGEDGYWEEHIWQKGTCVFIHGIHGHVFEAKDPSDLTRILKEAAVTFGGFDVNSKYVMEKEHVYMTLTEDDMTVNFDKWWTEEEILEKINPLIEETVRKMTVEYNEKRVKKSTLHKTHRSYRERRARAAAAAEEERRARKERVVHLLEKMLALAGCKPDSDKTPEEIQALERAKIYAKKNNVSDEDFEKMKK